MLSTCDDSTCLSAEMTGGLHDSRQASLALVAACSCQCQAIEAAGLSFQGAPSWFIYFYTTDIFPSNHIPMIAGYSREKTNHCIAMFPKYHRSWLPPISHSACRIANCSSKALFRAWRMEQSCLRRGRKLWKTPWNSQTLDFQKKNSGIFWGFPALT